MLHQVLLNHLLFLLRWVKKAHPVLFYSQNGINWSFCTIIKSVHIWLSYHSNRLRKGHLILLYVTCCSRKLKNAKKSGNSLKFTIYKILLFHNKFQLSSNLLLIWLHQKCVMLTRDPSPSGTTSRMITQRSVLSSTTASTPTSGQPSSLTGTETKRVNKIKKARPFKLPRIFYVY